MLRRLHPEQPDSFEFTPDNLAWAEAQISKYPEGRQASAIIPLLWRAQEQEGWLTKPAMEHVADMLGLARIRALEVATFYFMFQLQPTGSVAHIQVCGTTSCMICGAEDLIGVCRDRIAPHAHQLSADGKFSWEEVECLGACANAPMAQIGKDYYEDLTAERLGAIIDELAAGRVPTPGPQNGRYASEPAQELTSLTGYEAGRPEGNASVALARELNDTIKRIDGSEVPLLTPWRPGSEGKRQPDVTAGERDTHMPPSATRADGRPTPGPKPSAERPVSKTGTQKQEADAASRAKPTSRRDPAGEAAEATQERAGRKPEALPGPRGGKADDLTKLRGLGPKMQARLHEAGIYHFDQIAGWGPEEVAWADAELGARGRIERDDWVGQARAMKESG